MRSDSSLSERPIRLWPDLLRQWSNPRAVASWCLYDFANSTYAAVIPATIWAAYYADVIVGGHAGEGALWWGRAVSLTMLLVALSSPLAGAIADLAGWRKRLLILYTLLSVAGTALLASVSPGMVIWGFLLSVAAGFGFEGSIVFYNAYLPELAPPERHGRLSGLGFAVGYAGSFLGLLVALPLVGAGHFGMAFILTAVMFLGFSLPAFIWLPADRPSDASVWTSAAGGMRDSWRTARDIVRIPPLRRFLLAFLLYDDGVNTVIFFSAIFARQVLGFAMTDLIWVYVCVQVSALVGAALWAKPTDTKGPRFVVLAMLAQWIVIVTLVYFVTSKTTFFIVAALAGTGLGAIQAASRAFMSSLIPRGREGEFFGFYSLCGKSAAVMGPLVFGEVARLTGGNLRVAALSILVFFVVGAIILLGVKAGGSATATVAGKPRPV